MAKYGAVIFDFDFTLGDSSKGIEKSINYALSHLGWEEKGMDEIRKTIGLSLRDTYFSLTGDMDGERTALFAQYFKKLADEVMVDNTKLYPAAKEVLMELGKCGCKIGIVTTKYHYQIDRILDRYEMDGLVDLIVGGDDVAVEKPDPEGIRYAAACFKTDMREILYVGDSLVDAEAAYRAGVDFAAVLTGTTEAEDFKRFEYVAVAGDLCEMLECTFGMTFPKAVGGE